MAKGWVDEARIGCNSAFLTTMSTRFAAISVGAGNSNWATYYNTDIAPPFLQHNPDRFNQHLWGDPAELVVPKAA